VADTQRSTALSPLAIQSPAAARKPPNSERYSHISTAEIVKLSDQGFSHRKIGKLLNMGPCSVGSRLRAEGKTRLPARVSAAELKEARLDPAWEARRGTADRIVCRECGEWKSVLEAPGEHSHLRKHHMTGDEYRTRWPGARLINFGVSARLAARQGRSKTIRDLMDDFAASYLMPSLHKQCRRDPNWEEKNGIEDIVVCRLCGRKSRTDLFAHLKKIHGCNYVTYHEQFPKAPTMPVCRRAKKNKVQLGRGRRMRALAVHGKVLEELKSKPLPWRLMVPFLLQDPSLSNAEVQALTYTEHTRTRLSEAAMNRLRNFCRVPGPKGRRRKKL
jgi:hypothetical protein